MTDLTINGDATLSGETATLLAGRYRVVRQLGAGGMGSVWLAEDSVLDNRQVAVKMLPAVLFANKRAYNQLKGEALVAMKLSHPNIAAVRSFEENDGNPFIVEDYVEGRTLDDYLAEKGGTLSKEEVRRLLAPVAAALDYAHREGVVHRDVKPANVMVRKDGTPFVLDFGIAREAQETMTMATGRLSSGTLLYMGPEQLNGAEPKPAQDVYSFAAMAYECLAGKPPFCRGQIEYQIVNNPPPPLGPGFADCGPVLAGLAKDPAARPATCAAVLAPGGASAPRMAAKAPAASRGGRFAAVLLALLSLLAICGFFGWRAHERGLAAEAEAAESARRLVAAQAEAERLRREKEEQTEALKRQQTARAAAEAQTRQQEARAPAEDPMARQAAEADARRKENAALTRAHTQLKVKAERADALRKEIDAFRAEPAGFDAHLKRADETSTAVDWTARPETAEAAEALLARYKEAVDVLEVEVEWLKTNRRGRDAARAAGAEIARDLLPKADKAGAADYATAVYRAACALRERAERELAGGDFAAAGASYAEARKKFEQAAAEAVRYQFDTAMTSAEAAREEKSWQICLEEVGKALAWLPADVRALALKKEAEANLAPSIRFVAKLGDREVPATATFAGQSFASPWLWDKNVQQGARIPQSDVAVEYMEGGRRYVGTIRSQTVDWLGPKTVVVALTECKEPKAGDTMSVQLPGGETIAFKWCPPGTFTMGSPSDENGRGLDETQHRVTLTKGFWMGETEVTQAQWSELMGTTVIDQARKMLQDETDYSAGGGQTKKNREFFRKKRHDDPAGLCGEIDGQTPVYFVSWEEANEFCRRLTERARTAGHLPRGCECRLPTEAEWEYACRAGSTTALPNGCQMKIEGWYNAPCLNDQSWYGGNSSVGYSGRGVNTSGWTEKQYRGGPAHARRVKEKRANDFGLYDMIGNVYEWCADWYGDYPSGSVTDPTGAFSGSRRVNRGGGWHSGARNCRSAYRGKIFPGYRDDYLGFRVALAVRHEGGLWSEMPGVQDETAGRCLIDQERLRREQIEQHRRRLYPEYYERR